MPKETEKQLKIIFPELGFSSQLRNQIAKVIDNSIATTRQTKLYTKPLDEMTVPSGEAGRVRENIFRILGDRGFDINITGKTFQFVPGKEDPRGEIGYR